MSIIKIHLYRSQTEKQQKYLLTYLPEVHSTISHFLEFAIKALQIQNCTRDELVIQNDGYILPHCLDGNVIKQMQLLTIKVRNIKRLPNFWTAQKLDQELEAKENLLQQAIQNHIGQKDSESGQSTPKFSQDGLYKQNIFKKISKQSKHKKIIQKQPKPEPPKTKKKKIVEEIQQSSESEEEGVEKVTQKPKPKLKKKVQSFAKSSSEESEQQEQVASQSSESSEQSPQQQLPRVKRTKKAQLQQKVSAKKMVQQKSSPISKKSQSSSSSPQQRQEPKPKKLTVEKKPIKEKVSIQKVQKSSKQVQKQQVSKPLPKPVTYSQRKKIIQADDDIESSDSSFEQEIKKQKAVIKLNQPKMLPPALRNKLQQTKSPNSSQSPTSINSFKKHQQQQWIPITKEIMQKHKKSIPAEASQQTPFSMPNNLIRFKEIELDEEKFVPKTSEWIQATVGSVESSGKLKLVKVTQIDKQYRDRYETFEHNMVEFQVNKNLMTKQQKDIALGATETQPLVENVSQSPISVEPTTQKKSQSQNRNSLQKFICGQVNFYFSDKNYPFDLFMQMHANKHPQKYIPIRFLLNFPKIKKILRDQHKLFEYLVEDEKRSERNFEIDQEKRLVRKKVPKVQEKTKVVDVDKVPEVVNVQEVEKEKVPEQIEQQPIQVQQNSPYQDSR